MLSQHAPRDIRPCDFAIGETTLTCFEHFDIVRSGEPAWSKKGKKIIQPKLGIFYVFLCWPQIPRIDFHVVRRDWEESADGNRHDVVDNQVRENQQVAAGLCDTERAFSTEPFLEAVLLFLDTRLRQFAKARHPACYRAAKGRCKFDGSMAISQVECFLMRAVQAPAEVGAGVGQERKVPLMCGQAMISVDTVLDQQLPVGLHAVFLGAVDDLQVAVRLVDDQVEVFARPGQVIGQVRDMRVEAGEHEPAVGLRPRRLGPAERAPVQVGALGVPAGHPVTSTVPDVGRTRPQAWTKPE